jgi:yecA family protein
MRYEAFIQRDYKETGITNVIVTRTDDSGWLGAAVFLVDLYCLGIKDAFVSEMPATDWPQEMERVVPKANRLALHPACARKLVEGAADYAQALGFLPHRDYKKARRLLGSLKAKDCPEIFTYGNNGKPLFIAGPHDDAIRINRVMQILTAKLGPDGFHYILPGQSKFMEEDKLDALRAYFEDRPAGMTSLAALGGFFSALLIFPNAIPTREILDEAWAGLPPDFEDEDEQEEVEELLLGYLHELRAGMEWATEKDKPEYATDLTEHTAFEDDDTVTQERVVTDWCKGFLRATDVWSGLWTEILSRPELRPHLDVIRAISGDDRFDVPVSVPELPSYLGTSVLALFRALRAERESHTRGR